MHWRRLGAHFGGRGRRFSAEIFFAVSQNAKFGGRRGTHCLLELTVGSVLSRIDAVYVTLHFTLLRLICAYFWLGPAKYRNQSHKYRTPSTKLRRNP